MILMGKPMGMFLRCWFGLQHKQTMVPYINKRFFENPSDPSLLLTQDALIQQNEGRLWVALIYWHNVV
jgi:hypothetical protein